MKEKLLIFLCCFVAIQLSIHAQELTQRDKNILRYEAGAFVKEFELLLNNLSNEEAAKFERDLIIRNSFTNSGNQIFSNPDVIIEDDINPNHFNYRRVQDLYVEKYLRNFDIFYKKQADKSVFFTNIYVSEVKQGEYTYVEVFFNSKLNGTHLTYKEPYQQTSRIATIIANRNGKVWDLKIASIVFYNPKEHRKLFNFNSSSQSKIDNITVLPPSNTASEKIENTSPSITSKEKKQWDIAAMVNTSFESSINRIGIGSTLKAGIRKSRMSYGINGRYLFTENLNTADTTYSVNRASLSTLVFYKIMKAEQGLVPYANFGINYLSSWTNKNNLLRENLSSAALGALVGAGIRYSKKRESKLFFDTRLAVITGKASRFYLGVGLGYLIFQQ